MTSSGTLFIQAMAVKMIFTLKEQSPYIPLSFRIPYRIALYTLGALGDDKSSSALVLPQLVLGLESTAIKAS